MQIAINKSMEIKRNENLKSNLEKVKKNKILYNKMRLKINKSSIQ
jgi:hypothetical protein